MARAPKPSVKTIHHHDIAASLEAQSQAVMMLLQVVHTALSLMGDKMPETMRNQLLEKAAACQAAMWPQPEE